MLDVCVVCCCNFSVIFMVVSLFVVWMILCRKWWWLFWGFVDWDIMVYIFFSLIVYFLKFVFFESGLVVFSVSLLISCVVLKNGMYIRFCGGWLWLCVLIIEIILLWWEIIFILLLWCRLCVFVFSGWINRIVFGKVWCSFGIWWVILLVC